MASIEPIVRGALASHPAAAGFAREVARVHRRYAAEVVGAFSLCPFMKDPDTAFGHFCVMLDWTPDGAATLNAVLEADSSVIHLIFPCTDAPAAAFERFASSVRESLASWIPRPPVMAVFHPEMNGDFSSSHRLVGLVRRAPDPFIQLVPEGLHEGGTIFIDSLDKLSKSPTEQTFARLTEADRARIVAELSDIRADRMASYAPHIEALRRA
jgi:hypothetical protein